MSGTLAVYQKELATYFRSPIAYFVVAVFLLGTRLLLPLQHLPDRRDRRWRGRSRTWASCC